MAEIIHSYPWYPDDWRASETRFLLDLEGRSIYRDLLDYCWQHGSLPTDDRHLARIADCTPRQLRKHWEVFGKAFILKGDRWENEKVNRDRPRLVNWRETRRKAGSLGGKTRASAQASATASAQASAQAPAKLVLKPPSSSSSSSSSISTPMVPALAAAAPNGDTPENWAERLRAAHPKPSAKRLVEQFCSDHWYRVGEDCAIYGAFMAEVAAGLEAWAATWAADGNRYAPNLQTWLHDEGWRKAPPKPKALFDDVDPFAVRRSQ